MKTNSRARRLVRIRTAIGCLALVATVGIEFGLGESLAAHLGQTRARPAATVTVWNPGVGVADLFAVSR